MEKGFWATLKKPIIGLAPMDGVTDAPFRYMTAKYGKPDLHITEFASVEGICHGNVRGLRDFLYDDIERPIAAQIFGTDPESFYRVAFVVCELGFDGIDINMGCPAKNVSSKGAGAGLIQTPDLAKRIIRKTRQGARDWANGKTLDEAGLPENIIIAVREMKRGQPRRRELPVSVKTRIGFNTNSIEEWTKHLLEEHPVNISIHGRTLKQMYSGQADWDAIARAAKIIHQTDTTVIGNGDIDSIDNALARVKQYGVDGCMIGRAAFGNPWVFTRRHGDISIQKKLKAAVEHSQLYEKFLGNEHFVPMRKHLAWYCKGFHGASEVRQKLMRATSAQDVKRVIMDLAAKSG